ncbi:hypothetical protein DVA67_030780 [Solirubrobacter sp. CPCC 204708]|uniref:Uncharacterized protein n=1 Tax=Solirubrobacter deserti TaxID=2282478 RepID=A0ABT4RM82_9ACTN|nr:hypothetical protein [Solirubrobacter deserti]MBE2320389.1 hypothetical protein [Solirubrobacter deserti]MDA0139416.1 hypothetical protein [Solirubrobacter deserti]
MPSPQPTNRPAADAPTPKQLGLLRRLAQTSAQTFAYPATKAQASREIKRMLSATRDPDLSDYRADLERARELGLPEDAVAIRNDEICGYGADAHWAHTTDADREARS